MKYRHSHPVSILEHTSRFLILLLLPVLRALYTLIFTRMNFYDWLRGAWFDITTLMVIIGLGLLTWFRYTYRLEGDGIRLRQGIWVVKNRFIPYSHLSVITIERPFYLLPLRAVRVRADTDGGLPTFSDFEITLRKREVPLLLEQAKAPFIDYGEIRKVYLPKNTYVAVLSFVASNSLAGALFVATFISGAGKVLGDQFESQMMQQLTNLANALAFGIPPTAAIIAFVILGGWVVSFVMNLIRHLRFSVTRQGGGIDIQSGLVTRREFMIAVKRINYIELRQTLLTKLFGFYTAFVHANGYGKKKDELSVLVPASENYDISQNIELLLPEIPICRPTLKPRLRYLSRFLIPPLTWIGIVSLAWFVAYYEFRPLLGDLVLYLGIMAEIPAVWYLLVKILSFFHTGIGTGGDTYTFRYTYGYRINTVAVPRKRIIKLKIRRSLFQVMSGCCDVIVYTFSEGRQRHVIPNLNYEEVKRIMVAEDFYPATSDSRRKRKRHVDR